MPTYRKLLALSPDYGFPQEVGSEFVSVGALAPTGVGGVAIDAGGFLVSNVGAPAGPLDATNKQYVDNIRQGIDAIDSVRAASNTNIASLSGPVTVDGVALAVGDRVLLFGQTNAVQNGVWIVQAGAWTRPDDFATGQDAAGKHTFVESGTSFQKLGFLVTGAKGANVIGTSPLNITQFGSLGQVTAGSGLVKGSDNGNTISILLADQSGLQFTSGALDHLLKTTGGLQKDATGVSIKVNTNNTVATDAQGLRTLGLPSLFTINGNPVDANVTAANVNTLVDGTASLADALHQHQNVISAQATVDLHKNGSVALAAGDPVQWSATADTLQRCDAAALNTAQCIGITLQAIPAGGTGKVLKRGIAQGVFSQGTPGQPLYLAIGGGLSATLATGTAQSIVRIGTLRNSTDLDVNCVYVGQRSAS